MARNKEKAHTMLARFLKLKLHEEAGIRARPALSSECTDLNEAERWRAEMLRDITKLITDIQNVALEEHRIRELNDRINKMLRVKHHWEMQIVHLGGPDYSKLAATVDGGCLVGEKGYKYFGSAKDLPGVREYLEQRRAAPKDDRVGRAELLRRVDIDYFGFGDDNDEELVDAERRAEDKIRAVEIEEWKNERKSKGLSYEVPSKPLLCYSGEGAAFTAFVATPTKEEMEEKLLESKKQAILSRYGE